VFGATDSNPKSSLRDKETQCGARRNQCEEAIQFGKKNFFLGWKPAIVARERYGKVLLRGIEGSVSCGTDKPSFHRELLLCYFIIRFKSIDRRTRRRGRHFHPVKKRIATNDRGWSSLEIAEKREGLATARVGDILCLHYSEKASSHSIANKFTEERDGIFRDEEITSAKRTGA